MMNKIARVRINENISIGVRCTVINNPVLEIYDLDDLQISSTFKNVELIDDLIDMLNEVKIKFYNDGGGA